MNSSELAPAAALGELRKALRFETSLRGRTEGLTWIIWGIVSAATFLTFQAVNPLYYGDTPLSRGVPPEERSSPWWTGGLWVPWLLVGIAATFAIWRSAALAAPEVAERRPRHLLILVGWIAAVAAGWFIAIVLVPGANVATYPVMGLGTAWVLLGVLNPYRGTRLGRIVPTTIGAVIFAAGLLLGATVSPHSASDASAAVVGLWAAAITGLVPFLGGMWQALRG